MLSMYLSVFSFSYFFGVNTYYSHNQKNNFKTILNSRTPRNGVPRGPEQFITPSLKSINLTKIWASGMDKGGR